MNIIENILILGLPVTATVIALIIAVTKGITERFTNLNGTNKVLVTVIVALWLFGLGLLQTDYQLVFTFEALFILLSNFVIILLGAMGIYSFIPQGGKENDN